MNIKNIYARKVGKRTDTGKQVPLNLYVCPKCKMLGQPSIEVPDMTPEQKKDYEEGKEIEFPGEHEFRLICYNCGKDYEMPYQIQGIKIQKHGVH